MRQIDDVSAEKLIISLLPLRCIIPNAELALFNELIRQLQMCVYDENMLCIIVKRLKKFRKKMQEKNEKTALEKNENNLNVDEEKIEDFLSLVMALNIEKVYYRGIGL